MSATITLHLPDDLHQRLAASSEQHGLPLDQTVVQLLVHALEAENAPSPAADPRRSRRDAELARIRAALGDLVVPVDDEKAVPRSALSAAELRARLPVLDPPLSQTVIEGREDRF